MADYQYQWKQSSNYGGFGDDQFLGIKNSFASARGVEVRRNPHTIKLANQLKFDNKDAQGNTFVFEDFVGSFVTVKSSGIIIGAGKGGKIYRKTINQLSWSLVYTFNTGLGAGNRIVNCIEYNDFIYFLSEAKIHRIAVSDVAGSSWDTAMVVNYKVFQNQNANYKPALELNNKLYIGDGRHLGELSSVGIWTYDKIPVFGDEEIVALTYGGAMMRIFGTKVSNSYGQKNNGGHKYYWDGAAESYTELVDCPEPIHCAIANGGDDYVIAGLEPWIYLASGYTFLKMKKIPFIDNNVKCYLGANCIGYFQKLLMFAFQFPFQDVTAYTGKEGRGVMTYGKFDEKYPSALNFEYPASKYNDYDPGSISYPFGKRVYFGAIHNSNGLLLTSWAEYSSIGDTPISYGIDVLDTTKFCATGEIISLVTYGKEAASDKAAIDLKCAFKKLNPGEKIEIYLAKNLEDFGDEPEMTIDYSFTEDDGVTYPDRDVCFKEKDIALDGGDYTFMQTKVVLTAGTSQATSPEVIELSLGFDNSIELGD